ncbi:MAG: glycosyltransferase [Chitinophagales bacterium]
MNSDYIDIVIPVFNADKHIENTVTAFLEAFINSRIILIDDCSEDETWNTLLKIKETHSERISIVRLNKNLGQHKATFIGLTYSQNIFAVTTDDDMSIPCGEIEKCLHILKNSGNELLVMTYDKSRKSKVRLAFNELVKRLLKIDNYSTNHKIIHKKLIGRIENYYSNLLFIDIILFHNTSRYQFQDVLHFNNTKSRYNIFSKVYFLSTFLFHYLHFNFLKKQNTNNFSSDYLKKFKADELL